MSHPDSDSTTDSVDIDTLRQARTAEPESTDTELDIQSELEVLREENRRLREEYRRATQTAHRRSAIALALLGTISVLGAALFPSVRTVLLTLGAIGLFGAVLTYYLTPEGVITASVGQHIYEATATTGQQLVDELGLQETRVYLPLAEHDAPARLFVPQHASYEFPEDPTALFVTESDERTHGVTVYPTGASLFEEFVETLTTPLATSPTQLADQLCEGVVEQTELVRSAESDVDADENRLTVAITGSRLGSVTRFDHPVVSFIAVGVAAALETPVSVSVRQPERQQADALIVCEWNQ